MAEKLSLTSPITLAAPTTSDYSVRSIYLGRDEQVIRVAVRDNNHVVTTHVYEGAEATTLMTALNTANLSIISLQKRILNRLAADGKLPAGTVTGTPDA